MSRQKPFMSGTSTVHKANLLPLCSRVRQKPSGEGSRSVRGDKSKVGQEKRVKTNDEIAKKQSTGDKGGREEVEKSNQEEKSQSQKTGGSIRQ